MVDRVARRAVLGALGTTALAGCSEVSTLLADECSFGEGEEKRTYDDTWELQPGGYTVLTANLDPCDRLTLTTSLEAVLEDPADDYWFIVRLLLPDMYEAFEKRGEIESFTTWDSIDEEDSTTETVQDEQTFYLNRDRSERVETYYVVILNRPAEPRGVIRENRPIRVRTTGRIVGGD